MTPPLKKAALSMCHRCMGFYSDGKQDCLDETCPLYHWQPYRKKEPTLDWMKYNPLRVGLVLMEESRRNVSDEERNKRSQRMKERSNGKPK